MEISESKYLEISREGRILIIMINNPPHNYLHTGFFGELHSCQELMLSPDIDAIIFTGKGNVFSKGADIEEIKSSSHALDLKTLLYVV